MPPGQLLPAWRAVSPLLGGGGGAAPSEQPCDVLLSRRGALAASARRAAQRTHALRCAALCALLAVAQRAVPTVAAAADTPPQATDWARAAGASATASNAGFYAGFAAEARFALDGDLRTFWSSTGGDVCCTESSPAWLLLSLGAVRSVATLQLLVKDDQDMSYTFAVANASDGPIATVARKDCDVCVMNYLSVRGFVWATHRLETPVAASYVRLLVTWSAHGNIGGCHDMCDWATNVYELHAYSPGALPEAPEANAAVVLAPPPPLATPQAECTRAIVPLVTLQDDGAGALLRGDAALLPRGGGKGGAAWVSLTGISAQRSGAIEFSRVVHPRVECSCLYTNFLLLTVYVRTGGGTTMPGEGLVVSLVDANRQTPGATRYLAGCGTRPALPADAISVVLDSSDSDPTCDEPGSGARLVSTLDRGAREPLVVLSNTIGVRVPQFRSGDWVPLQFQIVNTKYFASEDMDADGSWDFVHEMPDRADMFAPFHTWVGGGLVLDPNMIYGQMAAALSAGNSTLDAFYIVVSARTGALSSDAHAVSGLRLECRPAAPTPVFVDNWEGNLPGLANMPPPPALPVHPPPAPSVIQQLSSAALGGISFAIALCVSLAALACACHALRRRRDDVPGGRRGGSKAEAKEAGPLLDAVVSMEPPLARPVPAPLPDAAGAAGFDVFLSYRRADYWLADTLYNKLRLCGLRVFKDVDGRMAGMPFGPELVRAVHAAPVFAPIITLPSLQRMRTAAEPGADADTMLGEALTALYFQSTGDVRLIHPLLAGEPPPPPEPGCPAVERWALTDQRAYADALAALPSALPSATHAAVSAALRSAFGVELPAALASLTVRDIMCGTHPVAGVLSGANLFSVDCLPDDVELYIGSRYAPAAARAAAEAAAARTGRVGAAAA